MHAITTYGIVFSPAPQPQPNRRNSSRPQPQARRSRHNKLEPYHAEQAAQAARALARLKRLLVSVGMSGTRESFKLAEAVFRAAPELKGA